MTGFQPSYELSMRSTLVEFSAYDSCLIVGAFLRRVLLFVYADAGALVFKPHMQRALALRLLARNAQISEKFTQARLDDFRSTGLPFKLSECSENVLYLGKRAQAGCRAESSTLLKLLRRENPNASLKDSPFDPTRYAWCVERALQDAVSPSEADMEIIFRSWADSFSHVLRSCYLKYIDVLASWPEIMLQTHQDFVETWPMTLEGKASALSAANLSAANRQ